MTFLPNLVQRVLMFPQDAIFPEAENRILGEQHPPGGLKTISWRHFYAAGSPTRATFFPDYFATVPHPWHTGRRNGVELAEKCSRRFRRHFEVSLVRDVFGSANYTTEIMLQGYARCFVSTQ